MYLVAFSDFTSIILTKMTIFYYLIFLFLSFSGFHMTPKLSKIFPESCMLIILGVIIGLLLFYTHAATVSPLTANVFFIYLLPPIVLDAGYYMPNRLFFDHLGTILMFAVIGTIWNSLAIGKLNFPFALFLYLNNHICILLLSIYIDTELPFEISNYFMDLFVQISVY